MPLRRTASVPAAVTVGLLAGLLTTAAVARAGVEGVALLAVLGVFTALVAHPRVALAVLVGAVVALEDDYESFLSAAPLYYELPGPLGFAEVLLLAVVAGTLVDLVRRRERPRLPGPLALPLLLLIAALALGYIVARYGDADRGALLGAARNLAALAVLPFLVVNLLRTRRHLQVALALALALALYKTGTGALGWAIGSGRALAGGGVLTYYGPTTNLLLLAVVLTVLTAVIARIDVPRIAVWVAPFALAVLILSFRRNFWIALVLGMVLVVLLATGQRGRALLLPASAALAVAIFSGLSYLETSQSESPVVQRVQSLAPSKLQAAAYERYRIDEQRNVRAEIAVAPLTGIGLGVPWRARYPLAVEFPFGRNYTHIVTLWYWLKLGLIGLVAYLWIIVTAVRTGLDVWRHATEGIHRAAGLGLGVAFLGLAVAETTGSFLGVDPRLTVGAAAALGLLAALWLQLPPDRGRVAPPQP